MKRFWKIQLVLLLLLAIYIGSAAFRKVEDMSTFELYVCAQLGSPECMAWLANRYEQAEEPNFEEIVKWYQASAERGHSPAMSMLGNLYRRGLGVPADEAEALKWYKKAVSISGERRADVMLAIGQMVRNGKGTERNVKEGTEWVLRSAEAGDVRAQLQMGQYYMNGSGVAKDNKLAYAWFKYAHPLIPETEPLRDEIKSKIDYIATLLSDEELVEAEKAYQAIALKRQKSLIEGNFK